MTMSEPAANEDRVIAAAACDQIARFCADRPDGWPQPVTGYDSSGYLFGGFASAPTAEEQARRERPDLYPQADGDD